MTRRWPAATVVIVALVGVEHAFAQLRPLIPRDILFGNPERTHPQISPDGHYLAYLRMTSSSRPTQSVASAPSVGPTMASISGMGKTPTAMRTGISTPSIAPQGSSAT
jgi:hypothetical protein